jgi:adenosylmethionine-8-amino-7-oxononanoate aminotransferase
MAFFSPPLIINLSQVDEMFDILEKALKKISGI